MHLNFLRVHISKTQNASSWIPFRVSCSGEQLQWLMTWFFYWDSPSSFVFSIRWLSLSLTSFRTVLLGCNTSDVISVSIKQTNKKIKHEFLCSHYNIEDGRKRGTFLACDTLLFQERKKQLRCKKKWFVQYMEKVLWLIKHIKCGLQSFVLKISCWIMLYGRVDELKLIVIKFRH